MPDESHLGRVRSEKETAARRVRRNDKTRAERSYYVGIDGEGQGRKDHRYVMLACSNADGSIQDVIEAPEGEALTTVQCLDFILRQPRHGKLFAYAFNYDLSKMLTDVDNDVLYRLARPELRKRGKDAPAYLGPRAERWKGYRLNLMGTKFTVSRGKKRRVIWDVFRFFQSKFTKALEDWKVGEKARLERMRDMKDKRGEFDKLTREQIRAYCFDECQDMAALAEKLTNAHIEAKIPLRSYFGAGSSASAMLTVMGIRGLKRDSGIPEMDYAIACAFFGGRFEHSVIGSIPGPLWGYDISSAYPYQLTFLPCLACGKWELTHNRADLDDARAAVVEYTLPRGKDRPWGPFPFRTEKGSIAFPGSSGGGWVWRDEYLAGERLFPNVRFKQAWVYRCDCNHRPFERMPEFYLERLKLGKEGAGIALKLGSNSCYGKTAQSVGNAPFQSWIWAGMITSGCRAQILDMLGLHSDWSNMLMVATDGIYTREKIEAPKPRDTGTMTTENKPLGGWERKILEKGIFAARPGIYFPNSPTEDELKAVRARGIGRAVMYENWAKLIKGWEDRDEVVRLANVTRFHGMKSSISPMRLKDGGVCYMRSENYGQWKTRPVELSFNPIPKRESINADGTLTMRHFPETLTSVPYKRSLFSDDARALKKAQNEMLEQPDGDDFSDYETEGPSA